MGKRFDRQKAIEMFTVQHLTYRQIGGLLGVSGAAICHAMKAEGVKSEDGEWVRFNCHWCGAVSCQRRAQWRKSIKHYCSEDCYVASLDNPDYIVSRQGQKMARAVVSRHFTLLPGYVVHHEDSNTKNNVLNNLRVFESQAEHMSYERGGKVKPIWDGRDVLG
jgi:hypothetical protein